MAALLPLIFFEPFYSALSNSIHIPGKSFLYELGEIFTRTAIDREKNSSRKKFKKNEKKVLTKGEVCGIIVKRSKRAGKFQGCKGQGIARAERAKDLEN